MSMKASPTTVFPLSGGVTEMTTARGTTIMGAKMLSQIDPAVAVTARNSFSRIRLLRLSIRSRASMAE